MSIRSRAVQCTVPCCNVLHCASRRLWLSTAAGAKHCSLTGCPSLWSTVGSTIA
jgi:hypothetical protein